MYNKEHNYTQYDKNGSNDAYLVPLFFSFQYAKMRIVGNNIARYFEYLPAKIQIYVKVTKRDLFETCLLIPVFMSGSSSKASICITFDSPLRHYQPLFPTNFIFCIMKRYNIDKTSELIV